MTGNFNVFQTLVDHLPIIKSNPKYEFFKSLDWKEIKEVKSYG